MIAGYLLTGLMILESLTFDLWPVWSTNNNDTWLWRRCDVIAS